LTPINVLAVQIWAFGALTNLDLLVLGAPTMASGSPVAAAKLTPASAWTG
jgi:hypothetical protein